ncbi:MAG: S8 family serine peptidase [Candidatus Poseidoniaceae archaeon]|nr:S8 family serine peptidase [Candidatus Poseidoniaceae archaeon]
MLSILLLSSIPMYSPSIDSTSDDGVQWIRFDLPEDSMKGLVGELDQSLSLETRPVIAHSRLGVHDISGVLFHQEIPDELLVMRPDLSLVLIDSEYRFAEVRSQIDDIQGISVREFIAPSGLLVQGTQYALSKLSNTPGVVSMQPVPIAMLIDLSIFEIDVGQSVRIESWRAEGMLPGVDEYDEMGMRLHQSISKVASQMLSDSYMAETGKFDGIMVEEISRIASEPSVAWIGPQPLFQLFNDQARNHMNINAMVSYYTTDLDGSGQIVAVADSGLDEDHGDFGSRVIGNVDVIGDGSTADAHSGHGTHVSCSVLGDGSRGSYSGVAPKAELYFQAMENDNSGNFQWASINNMLNTAYSQGARTHTNSWGSPSFGEYTSESEDVDDRARYYDQYYSGREGLTILFAGGNDGPDSGSIHSPGTAKNTITVGNSQNRYSGAPNSIMDSSGRGPVDDGRIKPDILAPGGYVRSCRAQEATDTGGASWSNNWYLEYSGTSMATPNAAGTAALIREYITEVAQRPEPQGALVKALMILGAQDVGTRDIPNMDEGWGRIDLKATLAPNNGRGIWVDDRSVLSSTGNTKSYSFNITTSNQPFKVVLAWSDERGSRFSNTQLVNDLDLTVTDPSGNEYKGNVFSQGRSTQGGSYDDLNNVEVVLVDQAQIGLWSVVVRDAGHSGSKAQPFAIAVSGVGVNDLRPDPAPVADSFEIDIAIPQVGDDVFVEMNIENLGNVVAESVEVIFQEEGVHLDTQTVDIGPGGTRVLFWNWQPQTAGSRTLTFLIDSSDNIDEINEGNNRFDTIVNVTTPGVRIESDNPSISLIDIESERSSWQVVLTNTALLTTNASISSTSVRSSDGIDLSWYVGLDATNFELNGQQSVLINVSLVHPKGPNPGTYTISLLGEDVDNGVSSPFDLTLEVGTLAKTSLELDYQKIPVHPKNPTSIDVKLNNLGNDALGYDLFLESPPGWHSGFYNLSSQGGANSASTGLMLKDGDIAIGIQFVPPQVMTHAGTELTVKLSVVSQSNSQDIVVYDLPLEVEELKEILVDLETTVSSVMPGNTVALQFTVENRGNIDLDLYPSLQLPFGWTQNTEVNDFTLSWTQSQNIMISITALDTARSGMMVFEINTATETFSVESQLDVIQLADPELTFATLEIEGESWGHPFGPGQHPSGVAMNYTWLVENTADTEWMPSVALLMDDNMLGECTQLSVVRKDEVQPLTCTIIISAMADPGSEPSFTVALDDGLVRHEEIVSMLVAATKEITWKIDGATNLNTGEESILQVTITNIGNTPISHTLQITPPSGWSVIVDGDDLISLEAGQSIKLRLQINPSKSGDGELIIRLTESEDVIGSEYKLDMSSKGEEVIEESGGIMFVVFGSISLIVIIMLVSLMIIRRRDPKTIPQIAPSANFFQKSAENTETPCWHCRQPIISDMIACPACGARYHSACSVPKCKNCSANKSTFVIVK